MQHRRLYWRSSKSRKSGRLFTGYRIAARSPDSIRREVHILMRVIIKRSIHLCLVFLLSSQLSFSWGTRGHNSINRAAVRSIPDDGPVFLKAHEEWISYLSTIPDSWRSALDPFAKMLEDPNHGWFKE